MPEPCKPTLPGPDEPACDCQKQSAHRDYDELKYGWILSDCAKIHKCVFAIRGIRVIKRLKLISIGFDDIVTKN